MDSRTIPLTTALSVFLAWDTGSYCGLMYRLEQSYLQPFGQQDKEFGPRSKIHRSSPESAGCGRLRQTATDPVHPSNTNWDSSSYICYSTSSHLLINNAAINIFNSYGAPLEYLWITHRISVHCAACQQTLMVHVFAFYYGKLSICRSNHQGKSSKHHKKLI